MESKPENMKVSTGFDILMGGGGQPFKPPPAVEEQQANDSKKVHNFQEQLLAQGTMNQGFDIVGSQRFAGYNPIFDGKPHQNARSSG